MTLKRVLCIMVTCVTTLTLVRLNPCRWGCICNYYVNKNLCLRFESGSCGFEYQALMALGQWTAVTLSCKFLWLWTLEHSPNFFFFKSPSQTRFLNKNYHFLFCFVFFFFLLMKDNFIKQLKDYKKGRTRPVQTDSIIVILKNF